MNKQKNNKQTDPGCANYYGEGMCLSQKTTSSICKLRDRDEPTKCPLWEPSPISFTKVR